MILYILSLIAAFGYDSGGSCEPREARQGRAQILATIPCDLTKIAYCNLPGTSYPWHAVRRFVHENQGLMKRMYGDVRHYAVLKTEFEENLIEDENVQTTNIKEGRTMKFNKSTRRSDLLQEPYFRLQSTTKSSISTSSNETKADFELETNLVLNSSGIIEEIFSTTAETIPELTTLGTNEEDPSNSSSGNIEGQLFQDTMKPLLTQHNIRAM